MALADILAALFPAGHAVAERDGLIRGAARIEGDRSIHVIGIADKTSPGVDEALALAADVLSIIDGGGDAPILVLLDSGSQRMSRRDELLGLNETLAHLAKLLRLAQVRGHRTVGLLYGGSAAGAFIATALACDVLVALPQAYPEVMDLPSIARVTKLPLDLLEEKAKTTAVFAPGLANLHATGAIAEIWDDGPSLAGRLAALLAGEATTDRRALWGRERGGRPKADAIAREVQHLAETHG
jgi:malonate decarboxylase gamma subunit